MNKNLFLCSFPVPNFLKMPSVGIDISDGSIRYVELVDKSCKKELGKFGRVKMPKGTVVKGEIKDNVTLVNLLKDIKKKNNFKFVRVSVVEKKSYIFKTKIPYKKGMSRDEIIAALSFKLEENVPISSREAIFDFDVLGRKGDSLEVIVSVLPKNIVDLFLEAFSQAGLTPLSLEVEAQAVARSVVQDKNEDTFMIVDFRSNRANISVINKGLVQLTSTLDIGGYDLVTAIQKHEDVSLEEAKKIKKEKGFKRIGGDDGLFYAMMNPVAILKDEIDKYLVYWHAQNESKMKSGEDHYKIKKIILCGKNGALRSLDDYLSLSLGINVYKSQVWRNIFDLENYIPEMDFHTSLEYAAAIGLAMRTDDNIVLSESLPKIN